MNLLRKAWIGVLIAKEKAVDAKNESAGRRYERKESSGTQSYPKGAELEFKPIGEPITKVEALQQCSGEALYTADVPLPANGVHGWVVPATQMCLPSGQVGRGKFTKAMAWDAPGRVCQLRGDLRERRLCQLMQPGPGRVWARPTHETAPSGSFPTLGFSLRTRP